MSLRSDINATNNGRVLTMEVVNVDGVDCMRCNCNRFTFDYDLGDIRAALAGVVQQNVSGTACGKHNLVVESTCRTGDLTLCGDVVDGEATVVARVHGVRYDFDLPAARSAVAVARTQAAVNS